MIEDYYRQNLLRLCKIDWQKLSNDKIKAMLKIAGVLKDATGGDV